ncbi:MAG: hypothetical protein PHY55_03870, partial [Bacteroidales bacterium]|nr:hypothetical protein [Bacteroidales bacterium]
MNDSDFNYLLSNIGSDVTINDIPARVLILNTKVNSEFDDKKIISKEVLKRGDLVDFDNNKYLVISEVNGDRTNNTYQALIRNTNYNIKFNFAGFIKSFPVILTNQALGLETNKYSITLPSGKMLVYLQENDDTLGIAIDQRFIKISNAYTVSGINRSMKGLILLTCDVDTFNTNDDKVNEIADKTDTWSIV